MKEQTYRLLTEVVLFCHSGSCVCRWWTACPSTVLHEQTVVYCHTQRTVSHSTHYRSVQRRPSP